VRSSRDIYNLNRLTYNSRAVAAEYTGTNTHTPAFEFVGNIYNYILFLNLSLCTACW
jgi:hypothetical protein